MKLPHLPPLLFAKEVLEHDETSATVLCQFPYPPTLAMLVEAAAQSSSAVDSKEVKEGFLVSVSDAALHKKVMEKKVAITVKNECTMGTMTIFTFNIANIADGRFTVHVK
jgi:hypothetical protein